MAFCERQWALIHLEQVWQENDRTMEGKHLHERADDPFLNESRGNIRSVRGMPLLSHRLKLRGVADVVEFHTETLHPGTNGEGKACALPDRDGFWRPVPVEYKRGAPKFDDRDAVQLCAQAMALEEMMDVSISEGFIFYGQKRRRHKICFTEALRERTTQLAERMYGLLQQGVTPRASRGKRCSLCSLMDLCLPRLGTRHRSVSHYLEQARREMECE